jgi:hypothetical protein
MTVHDITSFKIHQFKGVRATVEILPNGPGLIVIGGANGSGKSSVVDGVMQLMDPAGVKGIPKPIHDGKDSAFIEMTTSLAVVRRAYAKDGPGELKATAIDGTKYGSGKEFMLKSTGGQVFDTAAFAQQDEKDQRSDMLRRVDLPFDVDKLDADRKVLFDTRTVTTREVKKLTARLEGFAPHDKGVPDAEVSVAELMAKANAAHVHNGNRNKAADWASQAAYDATNAAERLEAAKLEAKRTVDAARDALAALDQLAPEVDLTTLDAEVAGVEETNVKVRAQLARTGVATELEESTDAESALTADIKAIDKQKADGLAAAKFPVVGLGIDATGITFDGIPFRQVNPAQQIIVAFDLFTVDKPDLRIIFIKNGDLLDADSLAGIEKLAIERGYYVIVERDRDNSSALGWTMKDGALAVSA